MCIGGSRASTGGASSAALAPTARAGANITPLPSPSVTLNLRAINSHVVSTFTIFTSGQVDSANAPELKHFMRCRRTGRELALASGLLAMLGSIAQQWPGRLIDIVSAFRSPPFGVLHSKHFTGHAIDLRVEGVKTKMLRDFIWREHREVGVGYYLKENFVHLDWRPGEPDSAWSAGHEGDAADYNPRWAWSARHPASRHPCEAGCS
jgi:uncharacterized protein YcbK (DUF882 family)